MHQSQALGAGPIEFEETVAEVGPVRDRLYVVSKLLPKRREVILGRSLAIWEAREIDEEYRLLLSTHSPSGRIRSTHIFHSARLAPVPSANTPLALAVP